MTDEVALERDRLRGQRAERLLSDEILVQGFSSLEETYLQAWRDTKYHDTDGRERLWQAVQIVGKVKTHLQSVVNSGKIAKSELDQIARLGERKKILGVL